ATLRAARDGDFSARAPVDAPGIAGLLAATVNELVSHNERLTHELVRVSNVVGRDGRIEQRASLDHVEGSWGVAIAALNSLLGHFVVATTEVARVISASAGGDFSQRMELHVDGEPLQGEFRRVGTAVNALVEQLTHVTSEVTRVAREVGAEGKLGAQA